MTQIGESIAAVFGWGGPDEPGSVEVAVIEQHSGEPVAGVEITLRGMDRLFTITGTDGKARFPNVPPGPYLVLAAQPEFEIGRGKDVVYVAPGEANTVSLEITRILLTVLVKRIPIGPSLAAMQLIGAGHHWIEIDGTESYGWYPEYSPGLSFHSGVPGKLNGRSDSKATLTRDVHHGEDADVMFHPRIMNANSAAAVKSCIRTFAHAFRGLWRYPRGPNCHTFQRDVMAHCGLGNLPHGKFVLWMFS